jgi:hypothetical protein
MKLKEMIKHMTSRKFIAMLLGVALGCGIVFGVDGEELSTILGAVTSLVSLLCYIFTEGSIDKAALSDQKEPEENGLLLEQLFKD